MLLVQMSYQNKAIKLLKYFGYVGLNNWNYFLVELTTII